MMWLLLIRRLLRTTGREAMMLWYALLNPATRMVIRLGSGATGLYLFSPLDIISDFMVLFGLADDLAVLLLAIPFLVNRLPAHVQQEAAWRADNSWLGRWLRRAGTATR